MKQLLCPVCNESMIRDSSSGCIHYCGCGTFEENICSHEKSITFMEDEKFKKKLIKNKE